VSKWTVIPRDLKLSEGIKDGDPYLRLNGNANYSGAYSISQTINNVLANQYYTLSGYVSILDNPGDNKTQELFISVDNSEQSDWSKNSNKIEYNNNWTYFEYTFKLNNINSIKLFLSS
jgi:hypothetical protein